MSNLANSIDILFINIISIYIIMPKRRTRGGKRKRHLRRKTRRFRKGTKSKTHRGKDFETRKSSKYYNSKRWKRMTGRRTRRAPLFPWA